MNGSGQIASAFPRPGRALRAVLILVGAVGILQAILFNWVQGGEKIFQYLVCTTEGVFHWQLWRLLTAGVLTNPTGMGHLIFILIGLYFLSPDLERRWGGARFIRFLIVSVVLGFLLAVGMDRLFPNTKAFHREMMFGAGAAITATAIAWSRANAQLQVRLFFVLPVSGRQLFWFTIGYCVLGLVYPEGVPEGVVAPFGGVIAGLLFGGTPSPMRTLYLRLKLAILRQKGLSLTEPSHARPAPPRRTRGAASPPLRVVYGGLEDELKKRKPPKDKRYLN